MGEVPEVLCYPQELNQVLMTLVVNALDAVEGAGRIEIRTDATPTHVRIQIVDDGRGIPPDRLESIFDIGFSEKNRTMRMHAGLANALAVAEKHSGTIDVESEVGAGTTFTIQLPVDQP